MEAIDETPTTDDDLLDDTPDIGTVYQREPDEQAVRVEVTNQLTVDQAPRILGVARSKLLATGSSAVRLVGDDPRRARINVFSIIPPSSTAEGIMIAGSQAEVDQFTGCFLSGVNAQIRYQLDISSELWVRPVDVNASGVFVASSGLMLVAYVTELWSR